MEIIIFNVSQKNIPRCVQTRETGLKARTPPAYVKKGTICLLRQTSIGVNPKNYGVVGVYRIDDIEKHNPDVPVQGWEPSQGWNYVIKLKELLLLP